ncbi:TonB-dependent receptor plug domain-containing protein [Brachyspira catarrhinii]|uniref:TonB-dependent receptor plug domain-containing protein n=1 Tax=Brachyspira catarrhinii TaxID=2528966 RepID=A0ABY2TUB2_9SPIR|nr:TonB-dependent receptor plug domain-containing protein [Brachyspira catarrhinii]TKZ36346.1 hypothetical protein EZH24_00555 [Brachyspira catarrhinii]
MKKLIIIVFFQIFIFFDFIYPQSYLIRELIGGIWVTSQVENTNSAQTNATEENQPNKEPIKVNNNIITSEEIDRMGYQNAQEVLANQPGFVNKGNYMGNEVVDPAGANADNIKIYVNNVLMNVAKGNADAGVDLRRIPANLIESIEIKGNSIYITTKTPLEDILLVSLSYGSYNTVRPSILFSKSIDKKQTFTFTADSYYSDGNYYYDFINQSGERVKGNFHDNRQLIINFSTDYKYLFDNKDYIKAFVNVSFNNSAAQYQIPPIAATDSWFNFTTLVSSISYNGFSDILDYNVTFSYLFDSFVDRPYYTNGKFVSDYKSHAVSLNGFLSRMDEFLPNTITFYNKITPEYRYDILTEEKGAVYTNFSTYPQRHSVSIKYEPQLSFGYWDENNPIFTLLLDIKYEFMSDILNGYKNRNYLAYSAAFNMNFYKGYGLYFSYSHDYTAPTFNDLYYGEYGNINLKSEDYNQTLTKLTLEPITNLKIEGSYAYTVYSNKIIWYGMSPTNVDKARSHIVSSSVGYEIPFLTYNRIKAKVGYSYQLAFMGENKLPKIGMPEDIISVLLGYDFISENNILTSLSLNIHYTYSTKRPITDYDPIRYSDDFHDFNISFYSIWFKHLIVSTHFKNIFNKTPILSTYSVAKPFTWEVELGYNF